MKEAADLSFYRKKTRPWLAHMLGSAAIVGHTTTTTTRLWIRAKHAGEYDLVVGRTPIDGLRPPVSLEKQADTLFLVGTNDRVEIVHAERFELADDLDQPIKQGDTPRDHSRVFDLGKLGESECPPLEPDTRYFYEVISGEQFLLGTAPSFRTMPGSVDRLNFGFYSCHMPFYGNAKFDVSMWTLFRDELRRRKPHFVLGGGDQVYVDGDKHIDIWRWLAKVKSKKPSMRDMLSWYRDIYRGYWGFRPLREVYSEFPNYMIWDDHEIMDGWGSYKRRELADVLDRWNEWQDSEENLRLTYMMRDAAEMAYDDYQHSHNPETIPHDKKGHRVFDYPISEGGCDFYVLDMRGHKNFAAKHEFRVLGEEQHERLEAWGASVAASQNRGPLFLVSPVPVVHLREFAMNLSDWLPIFGLEDDVRDHWEHSKNKSEVTRLLDLLFKLSHETERPLVVLSGDVHVGTVFSMTHPDFPRARAFQVTSSGITYAALGGISRSVLSKSVKSRGRVGKTKVQFRKHFVYSQLNFSLFSVRIKENETRSIRVDLVGQSAGYPEMAERFTVDLLELKGRRREDLD